MKSFYLKLVDWLLHVAYCMLPTVYVLLMATTAYAQQTSCAQNLRLAQATYDQGRLHEVPQYLKDCKTSAITQERVSAYKLLCLTYIYLEEPQQADEAMLELLRTDHYFKPTPSDPAEFVALYRTFRTDPIYRIGVKLGANATQPNVLSYVPANELKSEYEYGIAFQGGAAAEIPLKKGLTFNPEIIFLLKQMKYTNVGTHTDLSTDREVQFETAGFENHAWVSVPLSVQYQLRDSKLHPYVALGVSTDYLLSATNKFSRTKPGYASLDEQSENIKNDRNKINISAIASAGGKYELAGGFFVAEIRYAYGITKLNDVDNIYSNFNKVNTTGGYVDGIFKINSLSVTVGFVYNMFNPVKLKK